MTSVQAGVVLQQLRRLAEGRRPEPAPDGQLLERFTAHRDEAAFAGPVRRAGPRPRPRPARQAARRVAVRVDSLGIPVGDDLAPWLEALRLVGMPKGKGNILEAVPGPGRPYLQAEREIADGAGLEPATVNFGLKRGVPVKGRVLDKVTRRPVISRVQYVVFEDNPCLKEMPGLSSQARP